MFSMRPLLLIGLIIVRNAYTQRVHDTELILNAHFSVIGPRCEVGKHPHWDKDSQLLYWASKTDTTILSYSPATGEVNTAVIDTDFTPLTFAVPLKGSKDSLVVGIENWIGLVKWDGRRNTTVKARKIRDLETNKIARLNEGKADPNNRLWVASDTLGADRAIPNPRTQAEVAREKGICFLRAWGDINTKAAGRGSMGRQTHFNPDQFYEDAGSLYMVDHDGSVYKKVSPLQISNGLDWSPEADKMYLGDSLKYCVYEYDYNNTDGSICNPKVVFNLTAHGLVNPVNSLNVGLTVDEEGMIWVGVYSTPTVVRINPHTGKLLAILVLQGVKQVISVTWGGPKLDILFVTTASVYFDDEMRDKYSNSGKLIRVEGLGVAGSRPGTPAVLHWKESKRKYTFLR